jgi:thiosulfate reductase cytochrome b subunit
MFDKIILAFNPAGTVTLGACYYLPKHAMAHPVLVPGLAIPRPNVLAATRHSGVVRVTHWINALSFIGLVVSGMGILVAHPRFYWGETGGLGAPSLFDLPLPFLLGGPSGWGRYLHFQSAWLCVLNGLLYVISGFASRHFMKDLVPATRTLRWPTLRRALLNNLLFARPGREEDLSYGLVQRIAYLAMIFALFPLIIWTGLAMSPAITSVFPALVTTLGGHQTTRTIHFFTAITLCLFVVAHVVMVWRGGFWARVGAMLTGHVTATREDE